MGLWYEFDGVFRGYLLCWQQVINLQSGKEALTIDVSCFDTPSLCLHQSRYDNATTHASLLSCRRYLCLPIVLFLALFASS